MKFYKFAILSLFSILSVSAFAGTPVPTHVYCPPARAIQCHGRTIVDCTLDSAYASDWTVVGTTGDGTWSWNNDFAFSYASTYPADRGGRVDCSYWKDNFGPDIMSNAKLRPDTTSKSWTQDE